MFLKTFQKSPKGLLKACVIPRPIAWISSYSRSGIHNLAPFSYFNLIADEPPMLMFSTTGKHNFGGVKDTLANVEETKEFTVNFVAYEQREAMNLSSIDYPHEIDEFKEVKVVYTPGTLVQSRRILEAPISMECVFHQSVQLPIPEDSDLVNRMVLGKVVGIHVNSEILTQDNRIDMSKFTLIARLGYNLFSKVNPDFEMKRPHYNSNSMQGSGKGM